MTLRFILLHKHDPLLFFEPMKGEVLCIVARDVQNARTNMLLLVVLLTGTSSQNRLCFGQTPGDVWRDGAVKLTSLQGESSQA